MAVIVLIGMFAAILGHVSTSSSPNCSEPFKVQGDYCMYFEETSHNASSTAAVCASLGATLPYPALGDLAAWQTAAADAVSKCSVGKSNELTMAVTVRRETNTIEVVPMCVNNNDYYLTLDGIVLETSPDITKIENVTLGHHEVCIKASYDGEPKTLCFQVFVCSSNFPHWFGEYCFHIRDRPHTQISAENYCLDMSASLPYPMDDLNEWQTAMNAAITDDYNYLDLPWSGATMQSGQNWTWSNGDQVQTTAWATGQPAESESCSVIDSEGLLNGWACSQSRPKVLCQATNSTITTTTTTTITTTSVTTTTTTISTTAEQSTVTSDSTTTFPGPTENTTQTTVTPGNSAATCGAGCIIGIIVGVLIVALAVPAVIFRHKLLKKFKSEAPVAPKHK